MVSHVVYDMLSDDNLGTRGSEVGHRLDFASLNLLHQPVSKTITVSVPFISSSITANPI